jgi:hypothetical protein
MNPLEELLLSLLDAVPLEAGGAAAGVHLEVETIEVAFPIESHLAPGGRFLASVPRGRIATGFDPPHGELAFLFSRAAEETG